MRRKGKAILIGAGPGDSGLLTRKGAQRLETADVVIYDALVQRDLLDLVSPEASVHFVGKRSNQHAVSQEELNELLIKEAKKGKVVVRLKGGDPFCLGRGGEEAAALADAGIDFEIIPGVSSAIAVPAYAGIPLTHRGSASGYAVVTGHEDSSKKEEPVDWQALAKFRGTLVILMGVKRIRSIAASLIKYGRNPETPAALIQWGTIGRQKSLKATLSSIAERVETEGFEAPAVIVIGEVVKFHKQLNWFEKLPLIGKRIVVTRSRNQADGFSMLLRDSGAQILEIPAIRIEIPLNRQGIVDVLLSLNSYDWLVFTSANGVRRFFDFFFKSFDDIRVIGGARICVVGPATADQLSKYHLKPDLIPKDFNVAGIIKAFQKYQSIDNIKIALLRAEEANPELPKSLESLGAIVDDVACYRTVAETEDRNGVAEMFTNEGADWITFSSGSTVRNFDLRFDLKKVCRRFPDLKLASIGPETSKVLNGLDLNPNVEASLHTSEGLLKAILKHS
jgi:uroporphyrinogen III methyltransferase/synthase